MYTNQAPLGSQECLSFLNIDKNNVYSSGSSRNMNIASSNLVSKTVSLTILSSHCFKICFSATVNKLSSSATSVRSRVSKSALIKGRSDSAALRSKMFAADLMRMDNMTALVLAKSTCLYHD